MSRRHRGEVERRYRAHASRRDLFFGVVLALVLALAACGGDDGVRHLPDAPRPSDAAIVDTTSVDAAVMITTAPVMPTGLGSLCGVAFDPTDNEVLVYPCLGAQIYRRAPDGTALGMIARPGEAANDVDLDVASTAFTLGATAVPAGALLFGNGETDVVEIYVPEQSSTIALTTQFGASHVVGLAHHPTRGTLFAVQDRVAGATAGNVVAEIDAVTGAIVTSFSTLPAFDVNYGDLDVCSSTGRLFLVSSNETTVAELSPTGELVGKYALPAQVTGASGIALEADAAGSAWISDTNGGLWRISGLPCSG
jgi:hypothetical protein